MNKFMLSVLGFLLSVGVAEAVTLVDWSLTTEAGRPRLLLTVDGPLSGLQTHRTERGTVLQVPDGKLAHGVERVIRSKDNRWLGRAVAQDTGVALHIPNYSGDVLVVQQTVAYQPTQTTKQSAQNRSRFMDLAKSVLVEPTRVALTPPDIVASTPQQAAKPESSGMNAPVNSPKPSTSGATSILQLPSDANLTEPESFSTLALAEPTEAPPWPPASEIPVAADTEEQPSPKAEPPQQVIISPFQLPELPIWVWQAVAGSFVAFSLLALMASLWLLKQVLPAWPRRQANSPAEKAPPLASDRIDFDHVLHQKAEAEPGVAESLLSEAVDAVPEPSTPVPVSVLPVATPPVVNLPKAHATAPRNLMARMQKTQQWRHQRLATFF
jgi:hypothetical protein